jgi:hypothetical protein
VASSSAFEKKSRGRLALVSDGYPARPELAALACAERFDVIVANGEVARWAGMAFRHVV